MKKCYKLFLVLFFAFIFFIGYSEVKAEKKCITEIHKKYYEVDYDYFCGDNENNKVCVETKTQIGGGYLTQYSLEDAEQAKINESYNSSHYRIYKDKDYCITDKFEGLKEFSETGCFHRTDLDGKSYGYEHKIDYYDPYELYIIESVDPKYCSKEVITDLSKDSGKNYDTNNMVSCGNGLVTDIPRTIPKVVHIIYLLIQIAVPILMVIFGSLDFLKAVIAQKEDEMKKGQQTFIRRLITGIIVFFIFSIVKIVISFAGEDNKTNILNCASCFINNDGNCVIG